VRPHGRGRNRDDPKQTDAKAQSPVQEGQAEADTSCVRFQNEANLPLRAGVPRSALPDSQCGLHRPLAKGQFKLDGPALGWPVRLAFAKSSKLDAATLAAVRCSQRRIYAKILDKWESAGAITKPVILLDRSEGSDGVSR